MLKHSVCVGERYVCTVKIERHVSIEAWHIEMTCARSSTCNVRLGQPTSVILMGSNVHNHSRAQGACQCNSGPLESILQASMTGIVSGHYCSMDALMKQIRRQM